MANSAAEQRATIKQELLFQAEMKDREAKAAIVQRTEVYTVYMKLRPLSFPCVW